MRYLTEELPGIGGRIKERPEDFCVEELPLYPPDGAGQHTFFEICKVGLSTFEAVRQIARALHVSPDRIGYAGLKDAHAVTIQVLSVEGVPPEQIAALSLPGIEVRWAERHRQKLKAGHLRGNRFTIRVRGVPESALPACQAIVGVLQRRGVPNRFGAQRAGFRGDSARLGQAIVRRDARAFIAGFLGAPHPAENERVQEARAHFEAGRWAQALRAMPAWMEDERQALEALNRSGGDFGLACSAVPKRLKTFLVSAYQADLFNRVLEARLPALDQVMAGDLAMKHPGHSVFRVEDEAVERPRAARFEISPTGPLFGFRMTQPTGWPGELEAAILAAEGLTPDEFRVGEGVRLRGERRSLRFPLCDPEIGYDEGVTLRFWLPPGCYATAVLAEIMKDGAVSVESGDVSQVTEL